VHTLHPSSILLTVLRTLPTISNPTMLFRRRSAVSQTQESARRLALPGKLNATMSLTHADVLSFDNRETAEQVIGDFHNVTNEVDGVKLCLRFADTKAQKQLKQTSQEKRNWRAHEYKYSVEHTPSPTVTRLQQVNGHVSPASHVSYHSPAGTTFTPATSVSPP
jgi:hypothetical protein